MTVTSLHGNHDREVIDSLLDMSPAEFYEVVDRDIRAKRDEEALPGSASEALRSREVVERWYQALVRMKKTTEMTIAGKATDDKVSRATVAVAEFGRKVDTTKAADDAHLRYLKWRAGALRFLTGVEERLTEANYARRVHFASAYPDAVIAERNLLSQTVLALRQAIKAHRDAFPHEDEDPSGIDVALWAVLAADD